MGNYKEVEGDLIELALEGEFDVIAHGCNCFCTMGAGIAPQMAKTFGCDKYSMESEEYEGDIGKLGNIDYEVAFVVPETGQLVGFIEAPSHAHVVTVVNCYTQFGLGPNHASGSPVPLDYEALTLCLRKMNRIFEGEHIGLPQIGCGLAGGHWPTVKEIIERELKDCQVTVVIYKPK